MIPGLESNRLIEAVAKIEPILAGYPKEKTDALEVSLKTLTPAEIAVYQERKSMAQSAGVINLSEAMFLYRLIGEWGTASLAQKIVVTSTMAQIMGVRAA